MTNAKETPRIPNLHHDLEKGGIFEIKIRELLENHWRGWFEGMTLIRVEDGEVGNGFTLIRAYLPDQPALHGLLAKVRDLNLTLLSVRRLGPGKERKRNTRRRKP
jgi:hypothetical protein